jgi:cytochrome P450
VPPTWGGWAADVRDDPFPFFAEMRAADPVHDVRLADGHDAWLVLGYDKARRALNDPRVSKDMLAALDHDPGVVAEGLPGPAFSRHMLNVDPPDHTRLRGLVAQAFTPARVAALEPAIRSIAQELLDTLAAAGPGAAVDLVAGYARPLPFAVICELLGVPEPDRAALQEWFLRLLRPYAGEPDPDMVAASDSIVGYLGDLVAAARRAPGDNLVGALVSASAGNGHTSGSGDRLTHQELMSTLFQLFVAGHDTTTSLIGNAVVALVDHQDQLAELVADPGLLPAAVEELLRFCAPVPHATFRMTTQPVDLDGTVLASGRQVLVCLAAANRDPARWPEPELLRLRRPRRPHVAFGHGIHFCLGAPLARLEARIALGMLLGRFPALSLSIPRHQLAWSHGDGLVLRGLASLPVTLIPIDQEE